MASPFRISCAPRLISPHCPVLDFSLHSTPSAWAGLDFGLIVVHKTGLFYFSLHITLLEDAECMGTTLARKHILHVRALRARA